MGARITASRKMLWLCVWTSNSSPGIIGRWYLEYLCESRVRASIIRVDKGTETVTMATMHAFLRNKHDDDMDSEDTV